MFRRVPLSIIRSFSLYTQQWYMSYSLRAGSGRNCSSVLILLASCQQICMTYTSALCTVKNSWWWTEELSETCSFIPDVNFEKLVHLIGGGDRAVAQWLRCCATSRKVAGSIPAGVIGIFHWHKILPIALWPWGRLSLWQKWVPGAFSGGKGGRCIRPYLTTILCRCHEIWEP